MSDVLNKNVRRAWGRFIDRRLLKGDPWEVWDRQEKQVVETCGSGAEAWRRARELNANAAIVAVLPVIKKIIATVKSSGQEEYGRLKMLSELDGHGNACKEIDEAIDALIAQHRGGRDAQA